MGTQSSMDGPYSANAQPDSRFETAKIGADTEPADSFGVSPGSILDRTVTVRGSIRIVEVPYNASVEAARRANLIGNRGPDPSTSSEM